MVSPLTLALPCAGAAVTVRLVALPVIVGVRVLLLLLAATVVLIADTVGAEGVMVTLIVAEEEVPPGPLAVTRKLSLPL